MKFLICWLLIFSISFIYSSIVYPYAGSHKGVLTCGDCHTAFPMAISDPEGNVNLCLSCHTGGATASNLALYSIDQATITPGPSGGVYGKSHRWDAAALRVDIATDPATIVPGQTKPGRAGDVYLPAYKIYKGYAKVFKGSDNQWRIACSSCHNRNTTSFIRNEKERDKKLCAECHTYDFQMSTTTARIYQSGKKCNHSVKSFGDVYVGCSSCHVIHAE